jgi:hypothetical protein
MADIISETNQKLFGSITNFSFGNAGTIILGIIGVILLVGAIVYFVWLFPKRKSFRKIATGFEIVGETFTPTIKDQAKVVKLGSGGYEVLYLKRQKVYRLAYGGRVGKDTYYFFIMPDGYWYNGLISANLKMWDKEKGLVSAIATNPTMRAQYTSLEKQIDALHKAKKTFMQEYGQWIFAIGFILIAGVMLYLNYREFAQAMGSLASFNAENAKILQSIANLAGNVQQINNTSGLVPVG